MQGSPSTRRLVGDRYDLLEEIGRGGMGVVWRARDLLLQREVAVKEIHFPAGTNADEREILRKRVFREARAAARLSHPCVVTVYDVIEEDGQPFIVMELVDAPSLTDVVRGVGPLTPARAAAVGLDVLSALEVAHAAGVVHRDIKPGNVMVPERGHCELADFGIASVQDDPSVTSTGLVLGSPAYMAPEQGSRGLTSPASDSGRSR
jgi:serine/threonine protein kinase